MLAGASQDGISGLGVGADMYGVCNGHLQENAPEMRLTRFLVRLPRDSPARCHRRAHAR